MKINQPVTNVENHFPPGKYLVSKTDLKGAISYANDAFVEISGFEREELLGQNHNLVRHPDMPPQAFEDLWRTIKAGKPWRGMVKNRAKNGNFYWVEAFVVPVRKNKQIVGYMSVRSEPTRQQIAEAEALYQKLNASRAAFDSKQAGGGWCTKLLTIRSKLAASMLFTVLITVIGAGLALSRLDGSNDLLEDAYRDDMVPLHQVDTSLALMDGAFKHVALSLEHEPTSRWAKSHDHPISKHLEKISEKREELDLLAQALPMHQMTAEEQQLTEAYAAALNDYLTRGLDPALAALRADNFVVAEEAMLKTLAPLYEVAKSKATALDAYILQRGEARRVQAEHNYQTMKWGSIWGTVLSVLLLLAVSQWLAGSILKPLRKITDYFNHIAEGVLTDEVDTSRCDEIGELAESLAMMQVSLRGMLDAIQDAAQSVEQKSVELGNNLSSVVSASNEQAEQITSVAAMAGEFTTSMAEVAASAEQALQVAERSQSMSRESNDSMSQSMEANTRVVTAVRSSSETMTELDQIIRRIGEITKAIKGIADKTNLLALNAAIEAARAGEVGRGFAVVADEIRNLAAHTTKCTTSITGMVTEIQAVTREAVAAMDRAVTEVDEGVTKMQESVGGLDAISAASSEVMNRSQQIDDAARQQTQASHDVAAKMSQVAELVEQNKQAVSSTWVMMAYLLNTADQMKNLIGEFELIKKRKG